MIAKLTLTVEETVIDSAKRYAKKRGKSLSNLVENYLKLLSDNDMPDKKLSPKVKSLMGIIQLPEDYDYKQNIAEAIHKKYDK